MIINRMNKNSCFEKSQKSEKMSRHFVQVFLYLNMWIKHGELVYQAERKLRTSTHIPDLDNANVGMYDVDFRRDAFSWYLSFLLLCDVNQEQ